MSLDIGKLAKDIRLLAYNAYMATLVGSHAPPCVHNFSAEMKAEPRPGDLVIETSTVYMPERHLDGTGYFIKATWEPVDFGDPEFVWDEEAEGRPHPTEKCVYIRTLDGREFRWTNAAFIRCPTERLPF